MKLFSVTLLLMLLPLMLFAQNHLLISEIQVAPSADEFIEIFNPNPFSVSLDDIYLSDYNTYYDIVTNVFSSSSSDFLVKFPNGSSIDSAGVVVVAMDGAAFGETADFEIKSTSSSVPDMDIQYAGSSAGLANTSEMVVLFQFDGSAQQVYDVDYAIWGTTTSNFTDKSGIQPYLNDTPVGQQSPSTSPTSGSSIERTSITEKDELKLDGNGVDGHDETSEPINQNFSITNSPSPGLTNLVIPSGNGSGIVTVTPDSIKIDSTANFNFVINASTSDTLVTIKMEIPTSWSWSGSSADVQISGSGFAGSSVAIDNNQITFSNAAVTLTDGGEITIVSLSSPSAPENSIFTFETAVSGGTPAAIEDQPRVVVWKPVEALTIAQIQGDPSLVGQIVSVEGIVALGAGKTTTSWTDTYIVEEGGAGINVYQSGAVDPDLVRGNKVLVTGLVEEYGGVTEITNYTIQVISTGNTLPAPLSVTTTSATNTALEGSFIEVSGEVTDLAAGIGGGTNIRVNDGSGECLIRVWDATGVSLGNVALGKQISVRGPLDIYNNATQLILAYDEDLQILQALPGDGSGTVAVMPDSVDLGQLGVQLDFTVTGNAAQTVENVTLDIPTSWQWTQSATDVELSGSGFSGASASIAGNTISIVNASISNGVAANIKIKNLTAPNSDEFSAFVVKTAVNSGILTSIAEQPIVVVGEGINAIPISSIQPDPGALVGTEVTILGVVTIGAGITTTSWTSAYVQDNSGYGINVYQSGSVDPNLARGNLVAITGTVDEFGGITEIVNYTLTVLAQNAKIPTAVRLSSAEANDITLEGTYISIEGEITDLAGGIGGGTNIRVDDGSGEALLRLWDSAGINTSGFAVGDTIVAKGVASVYNGAAQILVGYQEDIYEPSVGLVGDGSGFAELTQDSVAVGAMGITADLSIWGTATDTLSRVQIYVPATWGWSGLADDVTISGSGLAGAKKKVVTEYGEFYVDISECQISATDSAFVSIANLQAANDSLYSYFWIKTGVPGGNPQFISKSPEVIVGNNPIYSISDMHKNINQFSEAVTLRGVVTIGAGVLRTDRTSAYMQDGSNYGINISASGNPDPRYQRAYEIQVSGSASVYRNVVQINPDQVTILDSSAVLPEPVEISTGEANSLRWDGAYVKVSGVVTEKYSTSTSAPFDYNLIVNDGTGSLGLRVWGTTGVNLDSVNINDAVIVSGVGGVYVDRDGVINYQLLPAYQEDVKLDPNYQPSLAGISLDVPPNPFVPDRGEKIKITYNAGAVNNQVTLRIFDLGGRMITTILDEAAQLIVNSFEWDGRDNLLDYVPLGTYICHLEVLEPITGTKKVKMVPVVVGTILKK